MESPRSRFVFSLCLGGALVLLCSTAWQTAFPEHALGVRVRSSLTAHEVWAFGVEVLVDEQTVSLQGFVPSEAARARILATASTLDGVDEVIDHMVVSPWPLAKPVGSGVGLLAARE